jgi:hypothetical protein
MPRLPQSVWLLLALAAVAVGCKPKIGEDCRISTDCSASGDRLCDITAPGGYCTMYNCEPGSCPEGESLCVQFGAQRSPIAACLDRQAPSPYARSFCMATCDSDSDCRSGYSCENLSGEQNPWNAVLIDGDRGDKACVVPISKDAVVSDEGAGGAFGDVCRAELAPSDAEQAPSAEQGGSGG